MPNNVIEQKMEADQEAQVEHNLNMASYHRIDERPMYDGTLDKFGEIRLRIATIDNPEIQRDGLNTLNELNTDGVVNLNTGKVSLRWDDMPGGVIRPKTLDGEWKYNKENDSINPEERDWTSNTITSAREMVDLTSPFIWTGDTNYCGLNYVPPVGTKVIVGFRKHGFPLILGYIPTHYKILLPVLKPGETCIKGYGNNYAQFRWSDKIDLKAWSVKGELDKDDPNGEKINEANCTIWLRLNANDGYIKFSVADSDSGKSSAFHITADTVTITTGTYNLQVRDYINIDAPIITQN